MHSEVQPEETDTAKVDQELLMKLLAKPEMASLLKTLAQSLYYI